MKKLLILSALLALLVMPAAATEATDWMMDSGISSGVGPGDYGAGEPLTWHQAVRLASRALEPDRARHQETLAWADIYDYQHDSGDPVTWADLCNIAVQAANPKGQYPMGTALLEVWQETGLVPMDAEAGDTVDRGDAAEVLYAIHTGAYDLPCCPIQVTAEEGYLGYPIQLVPVISALREIPDAILEQYAEDGWAFVVGRKAVDDFCASAGGVPLGVTDYGTHTISVTTAGPVAHELGHYLDMALWFPSLCEDVGALYRAEAGALGDALGRDYCTTNVQEYFAEAFDWYISGGQRSDAPGTWDYIDGLACGGWTL